jgi:Nucleotidyl transferase AbiEii toxin, Type IV TA system
MRNSIKMVLHEEFAAVIDALDSSSVEYALVGGLAVAVWGAPRATKDIDLLIQRSDLDKAKAAVKPCGFTLEALPFEFKDGSELQRVSKIDDQGDLLTLDLMLVNKNTESIWQSRIRLPFGERKVCVVSRDGLMAMKAAAARPQDLMDIENLKAIDR